MNNLVSRDPILRFKNGKNIEQPLDGSYYEKTVDGGNLPEVVVVGLNKSKQTPKTNTTVLQLKITPDSAATGPIYYDDFVNKFYLLDLDPNSGVSARVVYPIPLGQIAATRLKYFGKPNTDTSKTTSVLQPVTLKQQTPIDNYYLKNFEGRKNEITKLGGVRAVLKMLGFKGKDLDGKWGLNTENAYIKYLASQLTNPNISEDIIKPEELNLIIKLPVVQELSTPYSTNFNYNGSNSAIRNFGFNNYNGLTNFVKANLNNLFAKDLLLRFGNVNDWNLADVERALGVSGTYRRGINGDYSDIMRNMATWAGEVNSNRALKLFDNIELRPEFKYAKPYSNVMNLTYYKQGGSVLPSRNAVKRFLQGNKLPTAPKAEDRYKTGRRDSVAYWTLTPGEWGRSTKRVTTPNNAKIQREIIFNRGAQNNDTIYTEVPEHTERLPILPPVNIIPRKGFSFAQTPEYEILKRRFNTAWNLAK